MGVKLREGAAVTGITDRRIETIDTLHEEKEPTLAQKSHETNPRERVRKLRLESIIDRSSLNVQ